MKKHISTYFYLLTFSITVPFFTGCKKQQIEMCNYTAYVDPFIGVEIGNTLPGAGLPFGMVRLGPDVAPPNNTTGYRSNKPIRGFSHNHVSGTGGGARYGNVLVIPQVETRNKFPSPAKFNEYARPGYYSVILSDKEGEVQCELTTTAKAGFHRYTFFKFVRPEESPEAIEMNYALNYSAVEEIKANILIDASAIINMVESEPTYNKHSMIRIVSDTEIEGFGEFSGGWGGENPYTIYFVACFDTPFTNSGIWEKETFYTDKERTGQDIGVFCSFQTKQRGEIKLKVGISYVSIENARENIQEISGWDFDAVRNSADWTWNDHLALINVEGGTPELKTIFYTALYHALVMPTDLGKNGNPSWTSTETHYWDFYTLWDTYRTVMPLYTLILPERQREMIRCLLDIYEHRGWLPDAWTGGDYAYVQGGSNSDVVIADAVVKQLGGFDLYKAYEAIKKNGEVDSDLPYKYGRYLYEYDKYGYLSANIKNGSSKTLEYAYNDFCIAQVAKALGENVDYEFFLNRSYNSMNLFNESDKFFWAKDTLGEWMSGFTPTFRLPDYWNGPYFYEGTPWAYSTYFPHDMRHLIKKHKGNAAFVEFLDELFDGEHYELGNEPSFLTPYLYHYAGRPDKSNERVRMLLADFKTGRLGLPGQDDSGAMSSWFLLGSMGFFPVAGQDVYLIGSPLFSKSTLQLENEKQFVIRSVDVSKDNKYIRSATLNGKPWNQSWFRHEDIKEGGELVLYMSATPTEWGWNVPPPSISDKNLNL